MIEIKCVNDIKALIGNKNIPAELVGHISEEFAVIKTWCDEDNQDTIETFHTDNYGYGYIVILEGNETEAEIRELGLSEGLSGVIPEDAVNYRFCADKWTRVIVVMNDSYSLSLWLKNNNMFESYEREYDSNEVNCGDSATNNFEIF